MMEINPFLLIYAISDVTILLAIAVKKSQITVDNLKGLN